MLYFITSGLVELLYIIGTLIMSGFSFGFTLLYIIVFKKMCTCVIVILILTILLSCSSMVLQVGLSFEHNPVLSII